MTERSLPELEQERAELFARLAATGDFRRGSVNATYRRCGKANCACAQPGHPGHGPRWLWTRSAGGRTQTRQLAAAEVSKVRAELANFREFAALSEQIVEVSEAICQARPVTGTGALPRAEAGAKKGGSALGSPRRRRRR